MAQKGFYVDAALGIKIKPPAGWTFLGSEGDRGALRTMYCATKPTPPKGERPPHTSQWRVLRFASDTQASSSDLPKRTPYRNFDDYMKRAFGKDVAIKSSTDETVGDFTGRLVTSEITGARALTLVAFVTPVEGGELAIELEVVTEELGKQRKTFDRSLDSLAKVEVKAPDAIPVPQWQSDYPAWKQRSADERIKEREAWGKAWLERQEASDQPDWKGKQVGPYLVLSRTDAKYTKRFIESAQICHDWVSQRFASITDDLVMPAVIRIFDNADELATYRSREALPRPYHAGRREIYVAKDPDIGNTGEGYGQLLLGVFQHYVHDKDPGVIANLPRWFDLGMSEYLNTTKVAKRKIEFFSGEVELGRMKYYADNNFTAPALWALIQESIQPSPQDGAVEDRWAYVTECARLIRWFEAGGGQHVKQPDFVVAYLRAVGDRTRALEPDPLADVAVELMSEEELVEARKKGYAWRDNFLQQVNSVALPLEPDEWNAPNEIWLKWYATTE